MNNAVENWLELMRVGLALGEGTVFKKYEGDQQEIYDYERGMRRLGVKYVVLYGPDKCFYVIVYREWRNFKAYEKMVNFVKGYENKRRKGI